MAIALMLEIALAVCPAAHALIIITIARRVS
jgi:hypothetical protein